MTQLVLIANLVFVLVGVATTMLGPLLPLHAARFGLSDQQCGSLFLAQFFGGGAGSIISTELSKRCGLRTTIRLGLAITAIGILGTTTHSFYLVMASVALYGVGIGFSSPTITAAVSEASPNSRAGALNVLNFSWTVGAIIAPAILLRMSSMQHIGFVGAMLIVAGTMGFSALCFPKICASMAASSDSSQTLSFSLLRLIVATGIVIFIYVGIENGVAGWLPTLATRVHAFNADRRALLQGVFWTALLAGRLVAPLILRSRSEQAVLRAAIGIAIAGTIGIIAAPGGAMLFAAVFVAGFGLAPIFPTTIAYLSHHLGGQSGARLGWMFAAAGLGGAAVPYCVGLVSSATGKLLAGFATLVLAECLLFCANLLTALRARRLEGAAQKSAAVPS